MDASTATRTRLDVLASYDIMDSPPDARFDRLTQLAADLFNAPIAAINLLNECQQWSKSWVGTDLSAPLNHSFCRRVVARDEPLVIEDASTVPALADNPFVTDAPGIRFYAGAPIRTPDSVVLGTLCVIDTAPRSPNEQFVDRLENLAAIVADQLELHREQRRRRHTEAALRKAHTRYRNLFDHAADAMMVLKRGEGFVEANAQATNLTGYSREELLSMGPRDLITAESFEASPPKGWQLSPGEDVLVERDFRCKDGSVRTVALSLRPIDDDLLHGTMRDVTAQKSQQRTLEKNRQHLRQIIDALPQCIFLKDEQGRYLLANRATAAFLGTTPDELEGSTDEAFSTKTDRDFRADDQAVLRTGTPRTFVDHVEDADGNERILRVEMTTFTSAYTQERRLLVIGTDITDMRRYQSKIESLKTFYENALNELPVEVAIIDPEGRYEFLNPSAVSDPDMREWLIGKTAVDYAHHLGLDPSPFEERLAWLRRIAETGTERRLEDTMTTQTGETRHILRVGVPVLDDAGRTQRIFAYGVDLTEQINTRQALRESEQRWQRLVEHHPEPIMVSVEGTIVYVNQAGASLYEVDAPKDVIGRSVFDFIDPAEVEPMKARKAQIEEGAPTPPYEHTITTVEGRKRMVVSLSAPVTFNGQRAAQTVIRDITERKRREADLRRAKEKAEEVSRLKSAFLANMSHEIRTPLTSILGFAEVLEPMVEDEAQQFLDLIQQSGQRLRRTLTSVLDLAQLESGTLAMEKAEVDLCAETRQTLDLFQAQVAEKPVALRAELPDTPVRATLDPEAFNRILTNLVSNGIKFTDAGHVTVHLSQSDDAITVSVEDSGIGISRDFLDHVFDEFQQESSGLTRSYEGNGLGLTITHQLVTLMDGTIEVDSEKGVGTTFTVRLPCT